MENKPKKKRGNPGRKGATYGEQIIRTQEIAKMMSKGYTYSAIQQYVQDRWDIRPRTVDIYIARARELIREDWDDISREQLMANMLSQYSLVMQKAWEANNLPVVIGAINSMAKLTKLVK